MKRRLTLDWPDGAAPEIGRWLGAMQDTRRRTLDLVKDVSEGDLDRPASGTGNTIGTLLYHVAAIEADWLYTEILEGTRPMPEELFPFDVREEGGRLTPVTGLTLREHLDRLASVRTLLLAELHDMGAEDFHRPRSLPDYDVAPDWVLHHLMQHEAEHRAHIGELVAAPG
ncbi:MAG TPA: DinB family protein [Gemmatimonadales bacterium]|nr:DinB family protein [Gemmatimonadales bacterium]